MTNLLKFDIQIDLKVTNVKNTFLERLDRKKERNECPQCDMFDARLVSLV